MVSALGLQVFFYLANILAAAIALGLYGGWLARMRTRWRDLPLGWLLLGMLIDRASVIINEGYWLVIKAGTAGGYLDPSWLGSHGIPTKLAILSGNLLVIWAYFQARRS